MCYLVRLIPPSANVDMGTTRKLLDLGKSVITSWISWVSALSAEVNERSGMYPHSTVQNWASNLDSLANAPSSATSTPTSAPFSPWLSYPQPSAETSNAMVDSFRSAMIPVRDRFMAELGWLIGRRPAHLSFNWSNPASTSTPITTEDQEL